VHEVREAVPADLDAVVALTGAARRRQAGWSPLWWRPSASADELHPLWLEHLLASEAAVARVVTTGERVVGCAIANRQPAQWFVDDLCVADDVLWADAGIALMEAVVERPSLTCVATHHLARRAASEAAGLHHVSSLWIRETVRVAGRVVEAVDSAVALPPAPPHTFGSPLDPAAPGALLVGGAGVLVGSPSLPAPPVYDPGGTVCVVDRVVGEARPLLEAALEASGARGDVVMAVVAAVGDDGLRSELRAVGFERTVDVFAWGTGRKRRRR